MVDCTSFNECLNPVCSAFQCYVYSHDQESIELETLKSQIVCVGFKHSHTHKHVHTTTNTPTHTHMHTTTYTHTHTLQQPIMAKNGKKYTNFYVQCVFFMSMCTLQESGVFTVHCVGLLSWPMCGFSCDINTRIVYRFNGFNVPHPSPLLCGAGREWIA